MRAADIMVPAHELVHPDQPLAEAAARMRDAGLELLPVVDGDELVGVITAAEAADRPGDGASVHDVMSTDIVFCYDRDDLPTTLKIVEESGHPRLLVLNAEWELVGLLTARPFATRSRSSMTSRWRDRCCPGVTRKARFANLPSAPEPRSHTGYGRPCGHAATQAVRPHFSDSRQTPPHSAGGGESRMKAMRSRKRCDGPSSATMATQSWKAASAASHSRRR